MEYVEDYRLVDILSMKPEVFFFFDKDDLDFFFAHAIFHESGLSLEVIWILIPKQELFHHECTHDCHSHQCLWSELIEVFRKVAVQDLHDLEQYKLFGMLYLLHQ